MVKLFLLLGSANAFLFVAIGAFGAHALKDRLESNGYLSTFETGVQYHMIHAVALLAVAFLARLLPDSGLVMGAGWAFVAGIILFSGSLYALSLTGIKVLGAITPIGGVAFLIGWLLIFLAAFKL